jgi:hypothetical protein
MSNVLRKWLRRSESIDVILTTDEWGVNKLISKLHMIKSLNWPSDKDYVSVTDGINLKIKYEYEEGLLKQSPDGFRIWYDFKVVKIDFTPASYVCLHLTMSANFYELLSALGYIRM